jgi:hypothetical protein
LFEKRRQRDLRDGERAAYEDRPDAGQDTTTEATHGAFA